MTTIVPSTDDGLIQFGSSHKTPWEQNLLALSLTQQEMDDIDAALTLAKATDADAEAKRQASRSATGAKRSAMNNLRTLLTSAVKKINGQADLAADPQTVYDLAEIPAPKTPAPRPAPDMPTDLTGQINNVGDVELKWKGSRSFGVSFIIERRFVSLDNVVGPWSLLTTSQQNAFVDTDVPTGFAEVGYRMKAMRNELSSSYTEPTAVIFGKSNPSTASASGDGENMPMAA